MTEIAIIVFSIFALIGLIGGIIGIKMKRKMERVYGILVMPADIKDVIEGIETRSITIVKADFTGHRVRGKHEYFEKMYEQSVVLETGVGI